MSPQVWHEIRQQSSCLSPDLLQQAAERSLVLTLLLLRDNNSNAEFETLAKSAAARTGVAAENATQLVEVIRFLADTCEEVRN
jgi:hypothetical protein